MRYALVIMVLVVVFVVSLRKPFAGAVCLVAAAILRDMLRVETWGFFLDVHGYEVLYIAVLLGSFMGGRIADFAPRSLVDWGMLGFLLALLVSAVANGVEIVDHKYIDLFFKATVLYFLVSRLADRPQRVSLVAVTIVTATLYLTFRAWMLYREGDVEYARPYLSSAYHQFGLQLAMALPLVGALAGARRLSRSFAIVGLALFAVAFRYKSFAPIAMLSFLALYIGLSSSGTYFVYRLYMLLTIPLIVLVGMRTQSRSTYLGIGFGLLMLAWYYRKRWYLQLLALPLVAVAILRNPEAVLLRLESIWTRRTPEGTVDTSISMRIEQMHTAMRVIRSNPLLGIGPRQFFMRYTEYVADEEYRGWTYTMHSVPLLILCEEGLIGFAIYYGLIVLGCLREVVFVVRRARDHPTLEVLAPAAAGALMGFLAFLAFGLAQPQMWVVNIYATVALVSAARRTCDAVQAEEVEDSRTTGQTQVEFMPPGAATEVVFS